MLKCLLLLYFIAFFTIEVEAILTPSPITCRVLASVSQEKSPIVGFVENIGNGFIILGKGLVDLIPLVQNSMPLRKKLKKGTDDVSFSEYNLVQRANQDISKLFRLLIVLPLSPEFFFYCYLLSPLLASNQPWAWDSFPSTFDGKGSKELRETVVKKRRVQALVQSMVYLKAETLEDSPQSSLIKSRNIQLEKIENVLKTKSIDSAMKELEPWYTSRKVKKLDLNLKLVPGTIVKQFCRSLGFNGVPNIPLIRRFNVAEVNSQLDKIRKSDSFIEEKTVRQLSDDEVKQACFQRCIPINNRGEGQLRQDLEKWIQHVKEPIDLNPADKKSFKTNYYNKRLALMSVFVAKDLQQSDFAKTYRIMVD